MPSIILEMLIPPTCESTTAVSTVRNILETHMHERTWVNNQVGTRRSTALYVLLSEKLYFRGEPDNNKFSLVCTCITSADSWIYSYQLPYKTTASKLLNWQKSNISYPQGTIYCYTFVVQDFPFYVFLQESLWLSMSGIILLLTFLLVRAKAMPCCSKREQNA